MLESRPQLSIVTIIYSDMDELRKTCLSVTSQEVSIYEHIIVVSGIDNPTVQAISEELNQENRFFIVNKDTSLYNAMNIGLDAATGNCIFFLNGGDEFNSNLSTSYIYEAWQPNHCMIFRTIQYYQDDKYTRPSLQNMSKIIQRPAHQGFISPISFKKIYFDENRKIDADVLWMKKNINTYSVVTSEKILSKFLLGGLSTAPSIKTLVLRLKSHQFKKIPGEIIKISLITILGPRLFFRFISLLNSYEINSN